MNSHIWSGRAWSRLRYGMGAVAAVVLTAGPIHAQQEPVTVRNAPRGATVVTGAPAFFQPGAGLGRGWLEPTFTSRDIERYAEMLGLSAEQREAAQVLLTGYQTAVENAARAVRDATEQAREQFRESRDPGAWQRVGEVMANFRRQRETLDNTFRSDLQTMLDESQAQRWPAVERAMRRDRMLRQPFGLVSGERVDLFRLVEELSLSPDLRAPLEPVLERYELDLDRELIRREATEARNQQRLQQAWEGGGGFEEMGAIMAEAREAAVRVRDVNRRYARQLEGLLPADYGQRLAASFRAASFPSVYRPTSVDRAMEVVAGLADLDESQQQALSALSARYRREVDALNAKLAEAVELDEAQRFQSGQWFRFGDRDGPVADLRRQKRALVSETMEQLRSLLTEAQRARVPQGDEEDRERRPALRRQVGPPS